MYDSRRFNKASSKIVKRRVIKRRATFFTKVATFPTLLILLVVFLRADFLKIKNFDISGTQTVSQEEIKNVTANFISGNTFLVIPKSNILVLSKEKLVKKLLAAFPRLETVIVNKEIFSRQIKLEVSERRADFLWCIDDGSECFFMDKNGLVFEKVFDLQSTELADKIVFKGILIGNPLLQNFASPEKMKNYSDLISALNNAGLKVLVMNFESPDKAVAKTETGDIIFNPDENNFAVPVQNTMLLINETKSKNPAVQFQYIDTRFGNKVFYKLL